MNRINPTLIISLFLSMNLLSCNSNKRSELKDYTETTSGLKYKIIKEGNGKPAKRGNEVYIHEKMYYMNDSLLFDSRNLNNPIKVLIGGNQVIKGIDEALVGMKKGEIKNLIVPPKLSKRSGESNFPHPDSTLLYKLELIDILKKK